MVKFDSTLFGSVMVNGKKFEHDLIVSWDGEIISREKSHVFSKKELLDIMQKEPEVIIIGTGQSGLVKVEPAAEVAAKLENVELIAKPTPQAIEEFNKLVRRKKVVAVIHVTC